jgi:GTPase SAR1 family protein
VTNSESFVNATRWIDLAKSNLTSEKPIMLIGNKVDDVDSRDISQSEAQSFA